MPVDQVEHATQLVVSSGFLAVVGGLVVILVGGLFAIALRAVGKRADREAEERRLLFERAFGNGNGGSGGAVGKLMDTVDALARQVRELAAAIALINARLEFGDQQVSKIYDTLESLACVREKRMAEEGIVPISCRKAE